MPPVTLYSSTQASPKVLNCALDLHLLDPQVRLRPLCQLPAPQPARLASLRQEHAALAKDTRIIGWLLEQYATHTLLPDACHENGLRAELDATHARLRAVAATLRALEDSGRLNAGS